MSEQKNNTNVTKNKINASTVKNKIGKPNVTAAQLKEAFSDNSENEGIKINFNKMKEALKKYKDANTNSSYSLNSYDRETIRGYLQNPASNESNLRSVAEYLYIRSQSLHRLVHWYADMWDLRCRNVKPNFDLQNGLDSNALADYNETLRILDLYNLNSNMSEVLVNCYLYDACYFLWFKDDTGAIPYLLDPSECKIVGRYTTGDLSFALNMSKWRSKTRQDLIEYIGEPLKSMYNEYLSSGAKYVIVPDEYCGCFKFEISNIDLVIPPFAPLFQELSSLLDSEDLAAVQDKLDVFKMITMKLETIGKVMNDWKIDPDLAVEYFDIMVQQALPSYISAALIPGEALDVVDFSSSSSDTQINKISNAQKNVFNVSGGGAVLNASMINSSAAFKAWLQAETNFAMSSLIGQIDGFTNRMLSYDMSNPCEVKHFKVSEYTKEDFRKAMLESNQYSYMSRLSLGTLYGMSELSTLAAMHFEQEVLGLQNLMIYPLQSSYTQSSSLDNDDGGRPKVNETELSPSGERTRNQ